MYVQSRLLIYALSPLEKQINFRNSEIYEKFGTVILSVLNNIPTFRAMVKKKKDPNF